MPVPVPVPVPVRTALLEGHVCTARRRLCGEVERGVVRRDSSQHGLPVAAATVSTGRLFQGVSRWSQARTPPGACCGERCLLCVERSDVRWSQRVPVTLLQTRRHWLPVACRVPVQMCERCLDRTLAYTLRALCVKKCSVYVEMLTLRQMSPLSKIPMHTGPAITSVMTRLPL